MKYSMTQSYYSLQSCHIHIHSHPINSYLNSGYLLGIFWPISCPHFRSRINRFISSPSHPTWGSSLQRGCAFRSKLGPRQYPACTLLTDETTWCQQAILSSYNLARLTSIFTAEILPVRRSTLSPPPKVQGDRFLQLPTSRGQQLPVWNQALPPFEADATTCGWKTSISAWSSLLRSSCNWRWKAVTTKICSCESPQYPKKLNQCWLNSTSFSILSVLTLTHLALIFSR